MSMQWMGDLPNAGYTTKREKALSDAMMFFLRSFEREQENRALLLMMVIEGYDLFEARMLKAWRAWRVTQDELKAVWAYMLKMSGPNPQEQLGALIAVRPFGKQLSPEQIAAIHKAAGQ